MSGCGIGDHRFLVLCEHRIREGGQELLRQVCSVLFFFFFSSRRRHTRFDCDWSSDVCSSDLLLNNRYSTPNTPAVRSGSNAAGGTRYGMRALRILRLARTIRCAIVASGRSEEHTSELQSQSNLVCRLLLEKKKKNHRDITNSD